MNEPERAELIAEMGRVTAERDALYVERDIALGSVQQQRVDEVRAATVRAERAEAALARVKALHTSDYTYCLACHDEHMPCPTLRALEQS